MHTLQRVAIAAPKASTRDCFWMKGASVPLNRLGILYIAPWNPWSSLHSFGVWSLDELFTHFYSNGFHAAVSHLLLHLAWAHTATQRRAVRLQFATAPSNVSMQSTVQWTRMHSSAFPKTVTEFLPAFASKRLRCSLPVNRASRMKRSTNKFSQKPFISWCC